jgi:hypothetical protein
MSAYEVILSIIVEAPNEWLAGIKGIEQIIKEDKGDLSVKYVGE